jgi:hypothetical protein
MFPAVGNVVAQKQRAIAVRSSALFGSTQPKGSRRPVTGSGGVRTMFCHSESKWRS